MKTTKRATTEPSDATEPDGADRLLRQKGVARLLGITRHVLRRVIQRDPSFPKFIELAPGILMVRERAVRSWLRRKELEAYEQPPDTAARAKRAK